MIKIFALDFYIFFNEVILKVFDRERRTFPAIMFLIKFYLNSHVVIVLWQFIPECFSFLVAKVIDVAFGVGQKDVLILEDHCLVDSYERLWDTIQDLDLFGGVDYVDESHIIR